MLKICGLSEYIVKELGTAATRTSITIETLNDDLINQK